MEQIKDILPDALKELEQAGTTPLLSLPEATTASVKFEHFNTLEDPRLIRMRTESERFAAEMIGRGRPRWLTLLGRPGIGKTLLTKAIARVFRVNLLSEIEFENSQRIVRYRGGYTTWSALSHYLRDGEYRVFDDMCSDQFVALDDIGSEYMTDFLLSKLVEFCNRSLGKWRVINCNMSLEQISVKYDPRIASRMLRDGSIVVDVDAPDYNTRKTE